MHDLAFDKRAEHMAAADPVSPFGWLLGAPWKPYSRSASTPQAKDRLRYVAASYVQHRFACALNERAADAIGTTVEDLVVGVRYEPVRGAYGDWITEMMTELNVTENILRSTLFRKGPTKVNYLVGWAVLLEDPSAYPVPLTPGAEVLGDLLPPAALVSSTPMTVRVPKRQAR